MNLVEILQEKSQALTVSERCPGNGDSRALAMVLKRAATPAL
jgi:hypothetical protein